MIDIEEISIGAVDLTQAGADRELARLTEENTQLRQRVAEQRSLWQIAHRDPLTDLWNRRYADQRLAEEMSRAEREVDYRFSVFVVDLDDLKGINDRLGHAAGDQALIWVARFLDQGLRGHDLCCRLGGDEFLLVLPVCGDKECRDLMDRLRRRWHTQARTTGRAFPMSIGTASYPEHASTVEGLLAVADAAMYRGKRSPTPWRSLALTDGPQGSGRRGRGRLRPER